MIMIICSLINSCTIDWFTDWPEDALEKVVAHSLTKMTIMISMMTVTIIVMTIMMVTMIIMTIMMTMMMMIIITIMMTGRQVAAKLIEEMEMEEETRGRCVLMCKVGADSGEADAGDDQMSQHFHESVRKMSAKYEKETKRSRFQFSSPLCLVSQCFQLSFVSAPLSNCHD